MKTLGIVSWKKPSKGVGELLSALVDLDISPKYNTSIKKINTLLSSGLGVDYILNWGANFTNVNLHGLILNSQAGHFSDKLKFFNFVEPSLGPYLPKRYTPDSFNYLPFSGDKKYIGRMTTKGSGGEGIYIIKSPADIVPETLLITEYIKKESEYRVHYFRDHFKTIHYYYQKKKRLMTSPISENTFLIRNLKEGWVYSSLNFSLPNYVKNTAEKFAIKLSPHLTFGALDIIYNNATESAYVLEVNTAPGLTSKTAAWYADNIREYLI